MRKRVLLCVSVVWVLLLAVGSANAHASLARSEPPANAVLYEAPAEIRLYFTEPLEAAFSTIQLRDANGNTVQTAPAQLDPDDPFQMILTPGELPDGLYTVAWKALSSADGHLTQGSYPLVIGAAVGQAGTANTEEEVVPAESATVRWLNVLSIALTTGGIGFVLLVWRSAAPSSHPLVEQRLRRFNWVSWLFVGVTTLLILLLQVAIVMEASIVTAATSFPQIQTMLSTRFGQLWLLRLGLWLLVGVALAFTRRDWRAYWLALLACGGLMLTQSLFSHASGVEDTLAAVVADWLHLAGMSLWIGGLAQFINVTGVIRRSFIPAAEMTGRMVAHFSNLARASVALLAITGVYSAWLHVGSLAGLLTTTYGQALLIKTALMLPLLGIAAVNLFITQRRLLSGDVIWIGWLRRLVALEIVLTVAILGAVGVMTAITPARNTVAVRAATPDYTPPQPIVETHSARDGFQATLEVTPGLVGENTFTVTLASEDGTPIEDASLIRLRFDHQTENIGTSELRPEHIGGGQYTVTGANLSVAGEWRIRATIQRPGEFDRVIDYRPLVEVYIPPPPPALIDTAIPVEQRLLVLAALGMLCIIAGALLKEEKLLTTLMVTVGGVFLASAVPLAYVGETGVSARDSFIPAPQAPVRLAISGRQDAPLLVTAAGTLMQPTAEGQWQPLALDAVVRDVYTDVANVLWAVTDSGVYQYKADAGWRAVHDMPGHRVLMTHGYIYALGGDGVMRFHEQGGELLEREIPLPQPEAAPGDFVMLGNHTHVLLNGDAVFQSIDLGLSWQPLAAPAPISAIGVDPDGELLAATDSNLIRWQRAERGWRTLLPLPEGQPIEAMQAFNGRLYVAAGGRLYTPGANAWNALALPEADGVYITALAEEYPDRLWALDAAGARLFSTTDGQTWTVQAIGT